MKVSLAMLADYSLAHPLDGKLYVTGGGIRLTQVYVLSRGVSEAVPGAWN